MKNIKGLIVLTVVLMVSFTALNAFAKNVSFTQDDRDRLIKLETKIEGMEKRLDQIDRRIERLENVMMWGFGLLFTTMIGLVGFVLWDRRTALAPAIRKNKELEEREDRVEKALREYAKKEPGLAEVLKNLGLM